jgi:hypothetical protein
MLRKALIIAALAAIAVPAAAQSPEVTVQRPDTAVVPGKTYRLNELEKRQIEAQKQKEFEEAAARAFAPPPQHDTAAELRDTWVNPRDRSTGQAAVKALINSRPGATFNY